MRAALFADGQQISLGRLAEAIGRAPDMLGVGDTASLRVMGCLGSDERWWPFAMCLEIGPLETPRERAVPAGSVQLIETTAPVRDLGKLDALRAFLTSAWVHAAGLVSEGRAMQETFVVQRHYGRTAWGQQPLWAMQIPASHRTGTGDVILHAAPRGPVFGPAAGFIAESVPEAAAQWLGIPTAGQSANAANHIDVVVRDPRAAFDDATRFENKVSLWVRSGLPDLVVALLIRDTLGQRQSVIRPVLTSGLAVFELPAPLYQVDAFLLDREGFCFDQFSESDGRRGPFAAAVLGSRPEQEPAYRDLLEALEAGEDETTEVKGWLPIDRSNSKSFELLKTACAFANTAGGVLYIGITDNLKVIGTAKELHRLPGIEGSLDDRAAFYLTALIRMVGEGLSPSVLMPGDWIEHAGHRVLRLTVPSSDTKPHHIVETGEAYIRRGASNRLATPAEIVAMTAGR